MVSKYQRDRLKRVDRTEWRDIEYWLSRLATKDALIAEIGCGCGGLMKYLRAQGYKYIFGVEKDRTTLYCIPKVFNVFIMDLEVEYPPKADIYISQHVLEHIKRYKELVKWMYENSMLQIHIVPGHSSDDPTHVINHFTLDLLEDLVDYVGPEHHLIIPDSLSFANPLFLDYIVILSHRPIKQGFPIPIRITRKILRWWLKT